MVFFLPDLDRDLLEYPDLPVPPVSVEQGYVHINNNNNNKLYLNTIVIWAKESILTKLSIRNWHRNGLMRSYGFSKVFWHRQFFYNRN